MKRGLQDHYRKLLQIVAQRDEMIFMHFCIASILEFDGVNDPARVMFRDADDRSRATGAHVGGCGFRDSHTVSPCELRHYLHR